MKVVIFVDGGYINKILKNEFQMPPIDYGKLSKEVADGKEILRTYYYHCLPYQSNPATPEEKIRFSKAQGFHSALEKLPRYEVRCGSLVKRDDHFEQKGIDTLLSIDLVKAATSGKITDAFLIAGDGDFIPAVKAAKESSVNVILYYSANSCHHGLWQICDERFVIDQTFVDKIRK
jgi:uncharacterized LabA/DUF88 family protein